MIRTTEDRSILVMDEIDDMIDSLGGWPSAFKRGDWETETFDLPYP